MQRESYALLGTPGYIREPERFNDEEILKVLGANSGNLMFQFAATMLIDAPVNHIGMSERPYADIAAVQSSQAMILPAANFLRAGTDWTGLNNYLAGVGKPLMVLGLGTQSPSIGGEAATIAALKADSHVTRMAHILREKAKFISVRGAFSQKACHALGLTNVHVLGCPSAMINPDPHLGRGLENRLKLAREGATLPRLAVTAAAPFEIREDPPKRDLEQRLFQWAHEADGLYVQQSGGIEAMNAANGNWFKMSKGARASISAVMAPQMEPLDVWAFMAKAGRFYISAADWRDEMRLVDICMGTRLHGNMAAIAGGTPGVIIAHDSRTGELAETMHLPSLSMEDAMAATSLQDALSRVNFDGAAFDAWRARTARSLTQAFERIGIPITPHIRALAETPVAA